MEDVKLFLDKKYKMEEPADALQKIVYDACGEEMIYVQDRNL